MIAILKVLCYLRNLCHLRNNRTIKINLYPIMDSLALEFNKNKLLDIQLRKLIKSNWETQKYQKSKIDYYLVLIIPSSILTE